MHEYAYTLKIKVPRDLCGQWDKSVVEDKLMILVDDCPEIEFELSEVGNAWCSVKESSPVYRKEGISPVTYDVFLIPERTEIVKPENQ